MQTTNLFNQNLAEIRVSYSHHVPARERQKIDCSRTCYDFLREIFADVMQHHERFEMILLDRANKILGFHKVSEGGLSGTIVDPKIVFQVALKANASSIILAHNHPSGQTKPSDADKSITAKLQEAGKYLDLPVLDHIIVTDEGYFSFADEGLI
jgi:DNA repair protein RadC